MLRKWLLVRMSDLKRMKQCIDCARDPETCGCTDKDEDENGMCKKCLPRREDKNAKSEGKGN